MLIHNPDYLNFMSFGFSDIKIQLVQEKTEVLSIAQLAISIGSVILGKLSLKSGCNGLTDEQSAQKIGFKFSWPLAFMTLWPLALEPL